MYCTTIIRLSSPHDSPARQHSNIASVGDRGNIVAVATSTRLATSKTTSATAASQLAADVAAPKMGAPAAAARVDGSSSYRWIPAEPAVDRGCSNRVAKSRRAVAAAQRARCPNLRHHKHNAYGFTTVPSTNRIRSAVTYSCQRS
eukprot:108581-Prymnesium_polylepis.1